MVAPDETPTRWRLEKGGKSRNSDLPRRQHRPAGTGRPLRCHPTGPAYLAAAYFPVREPPTRATSTVAPGTALRHISTSSPTPPSCNAWGGAPPLVRDAPGQHGKGHRANFSKKICTMLGVSQRGRRGVPGGCVTRNRGGPLRVTALSGKPGGVDTPLPFARLDAVCPSVRVVPSGVDHTQFAVFRGRNREIRGVRVEKRGNSSRRRRDRSDRRGCVSFRTEWTTS